GRPAQGPHTGEERQGPQEHPRRDRETARLNYPRRFPMEAAETKPRSGQELELQVDSLAQGGRGIARANGYVVFVAGALPGDRVRVRLTKAKRAYAEGRAVELITPSADRIA